MRRFLVGLVLSGAAAGCSDGRTLPGPVTVAGSALSIIAGAGVTDTISAAPIQGLVAQVLTGGNPEAGVEVRFEVPNSNFRVQVGAVGSAGYSSVASAVTDAQGRATVRVKFGETAGAGVIGVTVPLYSLVDTARYTVTPGKPVRVALSPRDTVLVAGESFTYRGSTTDRNGNARSDPATFQATGTAAQVTNAGVVTAAQSGTQHIKVSASVGGVALQDSGNVAVVPSARLAVTSGSDQLALVDLSGRNLKQLTTRQALAGMWAPSGDRVVITSLGTLTVVDTFGVATVLPTPNISTATWPEWSADGSWIYFHGTSTSETLQIYRIHPDGTGLALIMAGTYPSPSPDGKSLAYVAGGLLTILDLSNFASKRVLAGTSSANAPRWSPDGQWIVYCTTNATVMLVHPDGTQLHKVGTHGLSLGVSWSRDSRFFVGADNGTITVVDVLTGEMTYAGLSARYPAWRK